MNDNVVPFSGNTITEIPPETIMDNAKLLQLKEAVVIGWDQDGKFALLSTTADIAEVSWLLRNAEVTVNDHIREAK